MIKLSDIRARMTGGFQPFVIRTSDGREFKVPHPEFILLTSHTVAVVDDEDTICTVPLPHIASIKNLAKSGKRGKHAA